MTQKKFNSGLESIENAPKSGRQKSASCDEIVSKVKEIVKRYARFPVRDIARVVDISLSRVHFILKNILNVTRRNPVSILRKSISGRHRPVRVADGPMTARCRFT